MGGIDSKGLLLRDYEKLIRRMNLKLMNGFTESGLLHYYESNT